MAIEKVERTLFKGREKVTKLPAGAKERLGKGCILTVVDSSRVSLNFNKAAQLALRLKGKEPYPPKGLMVPRKLEKSGLKKRLGRGTIYRWGSDSSNRDRAARQFGRMFPSLDNITFGP